MKRKFKLILLTAILCIASSFAFGQINLNKNFIGYWSQSSSGSTVRCIIFKDKDDILQMVIWDSSDGEELQVLKIQAENSTIKTTEKMISTNWVTYNSYSIVDKNTLKCLTGGDGNGSIVYFKRLK